MILYIDLVIFLSGVIETVFQFTDNLFIRSDHFLQLINLLVVLCLILPQYFDSGNQLIQCDFLQLLLLIYIMVLVLDISYFLILYGYLGLTLRQSQLGNLKLLDDIFIFDLLIIPLLLELVPFFLSFH